MAMEWWRQNQQKDHLPHEWIHCEETCAFTVLHELRRVKTVAPGEMASRKITSQTAKMTGRQGPHQK